MQAALGRPARFVLIEPQAACVARLRQLALDDAVVIDAALAEVEGEVELLSPGEGAGNASLFERRDTYFADQHFTPVAVRATTIDAVIAEHAPEGVDFCKLDVEGAEMAALQGATEALARRRVGAWAFEFGSANITSRVFFRDVWDLFTEHGYRLHRIVPGGRTTEVTSYYEDLEYFRGVTNYIAARDAPTT
jgi:FkbM family methyltransferase